MTDRPHCLQPAVCRAKTPGKHCPQCACRTPEARANKVAAQQRVLANPAKLARKQAACAKAAATPGRLAKLAEAMANPEVQARQREGCKVGTARRMKRPGERERMRQVGLTIGKANFEAARTVPAIIAKRGAGVRASHLAWCPEEHWPLNAKLKANGYRLAERKKIIGDLIESRSEASEGRRAVANTAAALRAKHEAEKASRFNLFNVTISENDL